MDLDGERLATLISEGEGRRLEFKRGLPLPERVARTLCAFANTKGGLLIVGVEDNGALYGVSDPAGVSSQLRSVASDVLEPSVLIQTTTLRLSGKSIVACSIPASRLRPHAVQRLGLEPEIVVRVGASNRVARGATLAALRRAPLPQASLDTLEKSVLAWVEPRSKHHGGGSGPGGVTVRAFAQAHNVGLQRARRAFLRLEREGFLVAYGSGAERLFAAT